MCLALLVLFAAVVDLHSQIPDKTADPASLEADRRMQAERDRRNDRPFDTAMKALNRPRPRMPATPKIDKETSERIRLARRVEMADIARYTEFLKTDKTGVFKLFPDYDCVTKNVIRTDGECKNFVMASSSFSFRTRDYSHPYYHDLQFNHGQIFSSGFFSQGILVSLGDVPIEDITPSHAGLKFIFDFQTASEQGEARSTAVRLKAGIDLGGLTYSNSVAPVDNTTYGLRSVAYNLANYLPAISETSTASELRFHTLSLDKRADVIIVFRIVRKGEDGNLTIVWKELGRKDAPKIKFPKSEKLADFKPDTAES